MMADGSGNKRKAKEGTSLSIPAIGHVTDTSLVLPDNLNVETWIKAGTEIARLRGSTQWWLGDWWVYSENRYGDRKAYVESDDWDGPGFQSCINAGTVSFRFRDTTRRRVLLSFKHHAEVSPLPVEWQDTLLDEAEEINPETGRVMSVMRLRQRVKEVRAELAQGWTPDQIDRREQALAGRAVVATLREVDGVGVDRALLAWADTSDSLVRIDRQSEWGNPFVLDDDGDRDEVIQNYGWYLDRKPSLQSKLSTLAGKVLACWCYPERCHGNILCERIP